MIDTITINNENMRNYIMFKLDKDDCNFTLEELNKITEIVIDYSEEEESSFAFLEELLKLKNLWSITLRNGYIYNDNYNIFLKLEKLEDITFENCEFENADLISSLKVRGVALINCRIENYSFINVMAGLEKLTVVGGKVSIDKLNKLVNLIYLQVSYSDIFIDNVIMLDSLRELYIDNTNINDLNFLRDLNHLERVSIDRKQYDNNGEIVNSLINNNVLVLNENMTYWGGEGNEI